MNQCSNCCEYFEQPLIHHENEEFCSIHCLNKYKASEVFNAIRKYKQSNPKEAKAISIASSTIGVTIAIILCPLYFIGLIHEYLGEGVMNILRKTENAWFNHRIGGKP